MTDESLPDFSGKLLLVHVLNSGSLTEEGVLLENAAFRSEGGRLFLTGRVPGVVGATWIAGARTAVAWDAVTQYLIFNSREDYDARVKSARIPPGERVRRWWFR